MWWQQRQLTRTTSKGIVVMGTTAVEMRDAFVWASADDDEFFFGDNTTDVSDRTWARARASCAQPDATSPETLKMPNVTYLKTRGQASRLPTFSRFASRRTNETFYSFTPSEMVIILSSEQTHA